jgi:hypothetical protein
MVGYAILDEPDYQKFVLRKPWKGRIERTLRTYGRRENPENAPVIIRWHGKRRSLARLIMGVAERDPKDVEVGHKDNRAFNLTRDNLWVATHAINMCKEHKPRKNNTLQLLHINPHLGGYRVRVGFPGGIRRGKMVGSLPEAIALAQDLRKERDLQVKALVEGTT